MINIFNKITKSQQEQMFFDYDILNSEGRLTESGAKIFLDLLFIGKTTEEAKSLIQEEIKKEIKNKK